MYTIQTTITVLGNKNIATLEEFYAHDMTLTGSDKWHNFGVTAKHAVAMNKLRDLKKEAWNPSTQQYTLNLYSNTEEDAVQVLQNFKDNNVWINAIENYETFFDVSEVIAAVSPLQVSGAVSMSGDWHNNPALDVNQ